MKGAISGAITALGLFLAIYAAESGVRFDWTETAMVAGITLLVVGLMKAFEIMKEAGCDED